MHHRLAASVILSLSVSLLGCNKIKEKIAEKVAEKAIEGATGQNVDYDSSSGGSVTIKDPKTGATAQAGSTASLPDDWPSSVPVYPSSKVQASLNTPKGKSVSFMADATPDEVATFYKSKLSGLKMGAEMNLGAARMLNFSGPARDVNVTITTNEGQKGSYVQLIVAEKS